MGSDAQYGALGVTGTVTVYERVPAVGPRANGCDLRAAIHLRGNSGGLP